MARTRTTTTRGRVLKGQGSFSIGADTSGLEDFLDALGDAAEEAVRPAAQAGIQVLYDQVKVNVASLGRLTGNLDSFIYQYYSDEKSKQGLSAVYHASWNHQKAPHGQLLEFGWLQRYRYYQDNLGRVRPMVRPGMEGKPRPKRRASQAEKDAYYVTLPSPRWMPGHWFVSRAADSMERAYQAAQAELLKRIDQVK